MVPSGEWSSYHPGPLGIRARSSIPHLSSSGRANGSHRSQPGMIANQDIVLPLLLAAIVANTVVMAYIVIAGRRQDRRVAASATRNAAIDRTLSDSYVDRWTRVSGPAP